MTRIILATLAAFAVWLAVDSGGSSSASPPPFPDELLYPNVVAPEKQFGEYGTQHSQLNEPAGVAISPSGEIFIADTFNHRVKVFTRAGRFARTFGGLGQANGQFAHPQGIAVAPDGSIAVADTGNNRIQVFDRQGKFQRAIGSIGAEPGQMNEPVAVAIDNKRIVVVDRGNERIQLFSRTGQILAVVGKFGFGNGEFNYPSGVAMDSRGRIFVADSYNNRIQRFDASGRFERHWGEWGSYSGLFATPTGLAFADNKLFVTDLINHRVQVFDVDGKYLFQWGRHPPTGHEGNGRLHYPTTIATAKSGKWSVVCEPFEYRCQVFSSLSLAAAKNVDDKAWWDKGARFHYGARVKSTGALLTIAEPDTHSVLVFDNSFETPQLITRIGGQGRDVGSFIRPSGMAIDEAKGQIIVSDGGNHRLETFELTKTGGGQVSTFAPNVSRAVSAFSVVGLGLPRISPQGFDASTQSPVEPGALLRDKAGLLYMADPHNARIVVFDQKMNVVRMFGTRGTEHGQLLIPNDLAFSVDGETLFVVDTYNFRLVAFSREGKFLFDWGKAGIGKSEFMHAFGIAAGRDGYVYVTDDAANRVQKFDEKGNFISAWGRWGTEPGQFYKPKGITQDDRGRIIIADFGNHRGQIMTANGDYIGMFGIGEGYTPPLTALKAEVEKNNSRDELSNGGNYLVHYDLLDGTIELNKPFSMLLTIRTTSGASLAKDVSLSVSATMPAHYHGMSTEPRVTRQSDGRWKVEGMLLHMQGAWQVNFDISEKKAVERAQIDLLIK